MISARSVAPLAERAAAPRFLLLTGIGDQTRVVDPEYTERPAPVTDRVEASLRAALTLHQISMSDARIASLVKALITESAGVQSAPGESIADWRFFRVSLDEHLYAPVLEFARRESVFPSGFEVAAELSRVVAEGREVPVGRLYERYLRVDTADRRRACTIHFRTRSTPGSWTIEYWFYYPFDVGGLGPHLHDPEHLFVEVDKLGSRVRRVNGRGTRVRSWQQPLLCR